jgi:hypothetical protein
MRMSEPILLVGKIGGLAARLGRVHPETLSSAEEVRSAFEKHWQGAIWVAKKSPLLKWLVSAGPARGTRQRLLLLAEAAKGEREFLDALFQRVVAPDNGVQLAKADDLAEILAAPDRRNYFIGGAVSPAFKSLVLYRGDLEPVVVPWSWFKARPSGPKPDFAEFDVVDAGQTVRLGNYEAATDAILYEFDADFRREQRKRRVQDDESFGGSLRRLRLQRGLSRSDFPGLSAKEIARIERGQVKRPHPETLATLARRLGVKAEDIATY